MYYLVYLNELIRGILHETLHDPLSLYYHCMQPYNVMMLTMEN